MIHFPHHTVFNLPSSPPSLRQPPGSIKFVLFFSFFLFFPADWIIGLYTCYIFCPSFEKHIYILFYLLESWNWVRTHTHTISTNRHLLVFGP